MDYKFAEKEVLTLVKKHIDRTYKQHYSDGKYQATDMVVDAGHGEGFCVGNIMKYAMRYGKKNGKDYNDLLKIIHYAIITISINHKSKTNKGLFTND